MKSSLKNFLRKFKKLFTNQTVEADSYQTINQLLYTSGNNSGNNGIIISTLPNDLKGKVHDDLERAAASVLERVALGALIKTQQPKRVFEIGTFRGLTCLALAENATEETQIFTLDLPPEFSSAEIAAKYYNQTNNSGFHMMSKEDIDRSVGVLLPLYKGKNKIQQLYADSSMMDFSPFHANIDFFFVDGCHAYDMAKKDTLTAWNCLSPGGMIVWHDYTWKSVRKAIKDAKIDSPVTHIKETSLAYAVKNN
ncbi:class I SAM-dependent methyltransferase [Marivirga sp. S37H4]|uniref:Class I SAM-dependent methyltransferase n=1 Tax=Marivirga aurantiaca TaxID=2802615 RepID=A0A934X0P5_9BACT|nr:class I SAM-dependent methyltransferase [Marivirga aurantiaca]MBK6266524.1 class I SAM-dependent methyltransferase [Marivirga aurantiaca]